MPGYQAPPPAPEHKRVCRTGHTEEFYTTPELNTTSVLSHTQAHLYIGNLAPDVTEYMLQVRPPHPHSMPSFPS